MKYLVESRRTDSVTIEGLGVLPPASEEEPYVHEVDEDAATMFKYARGLTPAQVTLPEGVTVSVILDSGEGE